MVELGSSKVDGAVPPDHDPDDHSPGDGPPQGGSLRPAPGRSGPSLPGSGPGGVGVPTLLTLGGTANLAIYGVTVLAGLLPFRPFEPIWQGTAVALCVNNGGFALMGLLLIQLAAYLDPDDADLQLRSLGIRHRAVAAALAFLLLIPLQVFASWRQVVEHDQEQARNRMAAERTFSDISRAVNTATTVSQLAGRLETIKAGRISQQDLNRPLAELQQEVMAGIRAARLQLAERINPLSSNDIWAIVQESLRRIAMALIFAMAFAGGSQLPGSQASLLDALGESLHRRFQSRLQRRHDRQRKREERIRFRDHLLAEARAKEEQQTPPDPSLDFAPQGHGLLLHSFLLHRSEPAAPQPDRDGDLTNTRTTNTSSPGQGEVAGVLPAVLRFVSSQDPDLHIDAELLPDGSGSLLRFNRPVMPLSFSFGPLPQRGQATSFSFAQANQRSEQGPMDWWEDFDYPLAEPFPLEPALPLQLVGAAPEALLQHHNPHSLLPIALLKAEEPHPGFLQVLGEEWQIWRSRLGGLWGGGSANKS